MNMNKKTQQQIAPKRLIEGHADEPILLGNMDVDCEIETGKRIPIQVKVVQLLQPTQHVILEYEGTDFTDQSLLSPHNDFPVYFTGRESIISNSFSKLTKSIGTNTPLKITWSCQTLALLDKTSAPTIKKISAHILSFPKSIKGVSFTAVDSSGTSHNCMRHQLSWQEWNIEICSHERTSDYISEFENGALFAVTHVVYIEKNDGSLFSKNDSDTILEKIWFYLSFCIGRRVGIGMQFTVEKNEIFTPLEFGFYRGSGWNRRNSHCWMDCQLFQTDMQGPLEGFFNLLDNPIWSVHLKSIIHWYLEANQADRNSIATDTGIVLAQMALEKISWVYLIHERKAFTEFDFDKLPASGKIRAAAAMMRLPLPVPQDILSKTSYKAHAPNDIPHLLTDIRNDIVHPKEKGKFEIDSYYAWNLAQWYIELMILRLSGHTEKYHNRAKIAKFRTQPKSVPWSDIDDSQ